jgi:hypothetical protein
VRCDATPTGTPTATPTGTPTTSPTTGPSSPTNAVPSTPVEVPTAVEAGLPAAVAQDDSISGGTIVGGVLAAIGIIIGLASLLVRRRRGQHHL